MVLPGLSGTEARQVAERVRAAMQAGARHQVSVAGGVAELLADESVESAVARANEKVRLARERVARCAWPPFTVRSGDRAPAGASRARASFSCGAQP